MLIKILTVALLASLVGLGFLYVKSSGQSAQLRANAIALEQANQAITDLKQSLKRQATISKETDKIVTKAVIKTAEVTKKAAALNTKVLKINKGVVDGKIDNSVADAAYLDSMWSAFCEADPSNSKCATRQPNPRFTSR